MWILYLMLAIIIIILIVKATIKLRFGFWGAQPVFHIYDLHHWISPGGIINTELPTPNKYVNRIKVRTQNMDCASELDRAKFCCFIRSHYLRTGNTKYSPTDLQIMTGFANNLHSSYLTMYQSPRMLFDKGDEWVPDNELIGVMAARPLILTMKSTCFPVYYVDYLCVHPHHRKKGIAPNLIQTHHYDTRHSNPKIAVHLFKREGELTAIVPLVSYHTRIYPIPKLKGIRFQGPTSIIEVTQTNLQMALEFVYHKCSSYDCVIAACVANIQTSIIKGCLHPYMLIVPGKVMALYILRDPALYQGADPTIECSGSLIDCEESLFVQGFWEAVRRFNKTIHAKRLIVETLGDNMLLVNGLERSIPLLGSSPTAYFLYNYASHSIDPSRTFMLL